MAKWLTRRSAKPLYVGSIPTAASKFYRRDKTLIRGFESRHGLHDLTRLRRSATPPWRGESLLRLNSAWVVKLADTTDLRSVAERRAGSTPAPGICIKVYEHSI